uniref:Uncharacterized protein n=1 Tax=Anguilla anguilla TaxID=7936 RepID=A0A0E9PGJ4_ANGAN
MFTALKHLHCHLKPHF